jgi:hypothetical protein
MVWNSTHARAFNSGSAKPRFVRACAKLVKAGLSQWCSCVWSVEFLCHSFSCLIAFGDCDPQMSTVLKFHQPHQRKLRPDRSRQRPFDVLTNVTALLSSVEGLQIHTMEDLRRAILILDLANMCIQLRVGQILSGTTREHLLAQSARIDQLIEAARGEAAHLRVLKLL